MGRRPGWIGVLALLLALVGCPQDQDDDAADDDAGDDDGGDDDGGDDDAAPECTDVAPPGYAGANGFHFVTAAEEDVTVENPPWQNIISSISSGLFVDVDNGNPPGTPVTGADYIAASFKYSF